VGYFLLCEKKHPLKIFALGFFMGLLTGVEIPWDFITKSEPSSKLQQLQV
jgi:hypothetical protein